jgi:DNA modification methylase
MTMLANYKAFLEAKKPRARIYGEPVEASAVNPLTKEHQAAIIRWMVEGGRRGVFARFGLGKTFMQLEASRIISAQCDGIALISAPLGVRGDFMEDAAKLSIDLRFIQSTSQITGPGVYLTNHESIRERKIDPSRIHSISIDEAAVMRGFGGTKTFREMMRQFEHTPYRFVATATPAPNEYIEMLAYAAFLGIMDVGEAKTRFFKRNSERADELTLHPHKEQEFWLWVNSWAVFLQKPSDLGFSDDGYDLPPLTVEWVCVDGAAAELPPEKDGQGVLVRRESLGVVQSAREKRASMPARLDEVAKQIAERPDEHVIIWHTLEDERRALEEMIPRVEYSRWLEVKDGHSEALALYERHYSAYQYADGRERELFIGPGEKLALISRGRDALFAWRKFIDDSGETGVNCAVFRNEGVELSSGLIKEAVAIARRRWPDERFYTYVDADRVRSTNPGYCFIAAGWQRCGETKSGLIVLEFMPSVAVPDVTSTIALETVYGSQDLDAREKLVADFAHGRIKRLAAKPVMLGSGCNLQRHCAWAIYAGVDFKFNDFIQSLHRIHRFLQTKPVRITIIHSAGEFEVVRELQAKWKRYDVMMERMSEIIRTYGLNPLVAQDELARSIGVERRVAKGDRFEVINADTVEETAAMADNSVGLIVTSIPFGTQYEYTPSYNDFGHTDDEAHFFAQMDFLSPELLRVLQPGRVMCVHVKDRVRPGSLDGHGFQTVCPFHADTILHYRRHGFVYLGMITVVTDVVRENAQTYRLGWSMQCDDGTRMGVGMPEYVLLFRKAPSDSSDGYADVRVEKSKTEYSRGRWQTDAHGFWRSSGNRVLCGEDLIGLEADQIFKRFRGWTFATVYDYERAVSVADVLDDAKRLPPSFQLLQPASHHTDVWTDVARMRTLNGLQAAKGREMHLCPLQFDIVDRLIVQKSNPGDVVFDPFGGLMTVPLRAVQLGRRGLGVELNGKYFDDGVRYLRAAEEKAAIPTLFDAIDSEDAA